MNFRIDHSALKRAAQKAALAEVSRNGKDVGAVIVSQVRQRFDRQGDEQIRWAGLWSNDAAKVAKVTTGVRADEARAREVRLAERNLERTESKIKSGEISTSKSGARRRRAKERLRAAKIVERSGTTKLFREGGEPLRSTGSLASSYSFLVTQTSNAIDVVVGSSDPRASWHHHGFKTTGRNYIPLTKKAQRGWSESLVPGFDYVVLQGVSVPARPQLRLTQRNISDIRRSAAGLK